MCVPVHTLRYVFLYRCSKTEICKMNSVHRVYGFEKIYGEEQHEFATNISCFVVHTRYSRYANINRYSFFLNGTQIRVYGGSLTYTNPRRSEHARAARATNKFILASGKKPVQLRRSISKQPCPNFPIV